MNTQLLERSEPFNSPLLTDLYQLTMLQAYVDAGMTEDAVFDLFVRKLPPSRNFLVAAGLEQSIEYLVSLRFTDDDIEFLARTQLFGSGFLDYIASMRFTGEVHALKEGTIFFPNEPVLRVTAPLPIAQIVESRLINIVHYQTLVATKAARCVLASPDSMLVDFGMRRAHAGEAALWAARASFISGFAGTSNVLANKRFGIPIFGTMAHSYIEAHDSEAAAFKHFCMAHRGPIVLLIDTYDTEEGARRVVTLARELPEKSIASVRLDSGDLETLSHSVRRILNDGGCSDISIFASGNLDEYRLMDFESGGAPIDGFGIGTSLDISSDCPSLDFVYKLQEYAGRPRRKRSPGKETWPGRKQIYREQRSDGTIVMDRLTIEGDPQPGNALLEPVVAGGRRVAAPPSLDTLRKHTRAELDSLPSPLKNLVERAEYPVVFSNALISLAAEVDKTFR